MSRMIAGWRQEQELAALKLSNAGHSIDLMAGPSEGGGDAGPLSHYGTGQKKAARTKRKVKPAA